MLEATELKIVLSTLAKRRAWLQKSLADDSALDADQRKEITATMRLLDSSMQKLSKAAPSRTSGKAPTSAPPAPSPVRKPSKRRRQAIAPEDAYVLIAEDHEASAQLLRGVLEDMGVEQISVVEDGRAAVYALQNASPAFDIVLCDWDMPEMDGLQVRKSVKNLAKLQDTHFVMVTAVSEAKRIREAIQEGVDDYIVKPVDVEVLEGKLRAVLAGDEAGEKDADESAS